MTSTHGTRHHSPRTDQATVPDTTTPGEIAPMIVRADARALPVPDGSVDLIVTSPPYFRLRSYTDAGRPMRRQIGAESSVCEYVGALLACTREMIRVLKPSGSIFVNLGDKYATSVPGAVGTSGSKTGYTRTGYQDTSRAGRSKSLLGIPWRYALRCVGELGLILRAEIIWAKPNGMPESVLDRVRRSHEQWFHFTVSPRYYSAVDAIREPHAPSSVARSTRAYHAGDGFSVGAPQTLDPARFVHPVGKLPGSVWEVPTQPLRVPAELGIDHYAAFPTEWPRRLILAWSPRRVCVECGQGRRPVPMSFGLDTSRPQARRALALARAHRLTDEHLHALRAAGFSDTRATQTGAGRNQARTLELAAEARRALGGYAREILLLRPTEHVEACACERPMAATRPGVVLDPFGGTGSTALAATVLGRRAISMDASGDYCRLATWRITDPGQRRRITPGRDQPSSPISAV